MMSLLELFVNVDDFCQIFLPVWEAKQLEDGSKKRLRRGQLRVSEIMTIIIHFHQSQYRNFKAYYTGHVCQHLCSESEPGELRTLCSFDTFCLWTLECLSEKLVWSLSRHFVC